MNRLTEPNKQSELELDEKAVQLGTPAWMAEYAYQRYFALSPQASVEVIERPLVIDIPGSCYFVKGLMKWQGKWLPVIDIQHLVGADVSQINEPIRYALVVAYQTAPYRPLEYGALALSSLPMMVYVNDMQVSSLPYDNELWPLISLSCFQHDSTPVPIVDCGGLFGSTFD